MGEKTKRQKSGQNRGKGGRRRRDQKKEIIKLRKTKKCECIQLMQKTLVYSLLGNWSWVGKKS